MAAGLDVFAKEPDVPAALMEMDNVVLLPHVGSASVYTRDKMDQLVVDNILAWAGGQPPLTPVAEDAVARQLAETADTPASRQCMRSQVLHPSIGRQRKAR